MKIRVWCDSGANAYSKREETVDVADMGFTPESWAAATEDEREKAVKEIAFANLDWGYAETE